VIIPANAPVKAWVTLEWHMMLVRLLGPLWFVMLLRFVTLL